MRLYHGSNVEIRKPSLLKSRKSGVLDAPAAISELKAYKTYNQLSFHTPRVIQALRLVECYEVK